MTKQYYLLVCAVVTFPAFAQTPNGEFVGSQACATGHRSIYDRWQKTRMANVLQDVRQRPEVVLGDFSTPNPLVTFKLEDVVFTYGANGSNGTIPGTATIISCKAPSGM